ncbi:hypothetical protein [Halomonas sp. PR-M31]|uniref:hypothetical protein n=1 Tax=Halomonas sp. PR-M31 TaxID=1471202 RepID=UPI000A72EDF4|nr:hypothetical protein [Halomonas sp. PR-M31]
MAKQKNLSHISYGLETPRDLLGKLLHDAEKINCSSHRYDLFNFFVTAAVLYEWCQQCFRQYPISKQLTKAVGQSLYESLPHKASEWIKDYSCLPNSGQDARRHIVHALRICIETANASKHYHWLRSSQVSSIEDQPVVKDWYQYFFTAVDEGIYIEYANQYYTVEQVRDIVVQFFEGLLEYVSCPLTITVKATAAPLRLRFHFAAARAVGSITALSDQRRERAKLIQ